MICVCVMTDGRDYLDKTLTAFQYLEGPVTRLILHDDSGDPVHVPDFEQWGSHKRLGFAGAYHSAWLKLREIEEPYIFSIEDDMVLNGSVNLMELAAILETNPHLAQMALKRQGWNDLEKKAGGVVETNPTAYQDRVDGPFEWLEHSLFFTTNAFLMRKSLVEEYEWPLGPRSEGMFSLRLVEDGYKFGYWGGRYSPPAVTHIGETRTGYGY